MSNSKAKGGAWERKIARFLTMWMSGQDDDLWCYRSPGSGAVATLSKENKDLSGDLIPLKLEAASLFDKFSIECKNGYKGANPLKVFGNLKGNELKDFWIQACRDAQKAKKLPMLIYNPPGRAPALVGLCNFGQESYFRFDENIPCVFIRFPKEKDDYGLTLGLPGMNLYELKTLFDMNPYWEKNTASVSI
jgi:hypothetical protein